MTRVILALGVSVLTLSFYATAPTTADAQTVDQFTKDRRLPGGPSRSGDLHPYERGKVGPYKGSGGNSGNTEKATKSSGNNQKAPKANGTTGGGGGMQYYK
jgi:hypothetical protein